MPTIARRKRARGGYTYQAQIKVTNPHTGKKHTASATFDTKAEAKRWLRQNKRDIVRELEAPPGPTPTTTGPATPMTLGEACKRYRERVSPFNKGHESEAYRLARFERSHPLRDRPITDITRLEIVDWRDSRLLEVAPNTVQREFYLIQQVFVRAIEEWGQERDDNPTRGLRPLRFRDQRSRRLEPVERDYLLAACVPENGQGNAQSRTPHLAPLILLSLETAMRRGELVSLEWRHVYFEDAIAVLHDTKNGDARRVPLTPEALDALRTLHAVTGTSKYVSPYSSNAIHLAWRRLRRRARDLYHADCAADGKQPNEEMFENLRWHDLRHEGISSLSERFSLNTRDLQLISGHRDLRSLMRYEHKRVESVVALLHSKD